MKSQEIKSKALELYLRNVPVWTISKQLNITQKTLHHWKKQYSWDKLKEEYINKLSINVTDKIIKEQLAITELAQELLVERLKYNQEDVKSNELVSLLKHRLELVRPKQTTNNLNITKNENQVIQVIIPKEVEDLLNGEISSDKKTGIRLLETS